MLRLFCASVLLSSGILLLVALMLGRPPAWLLKAEVCCGCAGALVYGFTGLRFRLPFAVFRPLQGVLFMALGSIALFVPPQIPIAAFFLGVGIRKLWASACDLAEPKGTDLAVSPSDIQLRS